MSQPLPPSAFQTFEEEEGLKQWWEQDQVESTKKGEQRWATLRHNGVLFPEPYQPHGISIDYNGQEFKMNEEEEEVVTYFAQMRESPYYTQKVFRMNWFRCWLKVLAKRPEGHPIRDIALLNLDRIWEWDVKRRDAKKALPKEEKTRLKEEQNAVAAPFVYCLWDGRKEEVANYRVEPPGLFRGRGEHPKRGMLKKRVAPEDITLNLDPDAPVPPAPPGHRWGGVVHDNTKTWLAKWDDTVTGDQKYVMLGASSTVKGLSDRDKFERARRLHQFIDKIRNHYYAQMRSKDRREQQLGVATYFIDVLALRAGNEKTEDEADTVGCCSLRVEHVSCLDDNIIHLDFPGKDSIRYDNKVKVDPIVHERVREFVSGKTKGTDLFNLIESSDVNENFKQFMPDLTAKVFRTYNASKTLEKYFLDNPLPKKATPAEKMVYFNKANTEVAVLCNHQKSVGRAHYKTMQKMEKQEEDMRLTVERLRKAKAEVGRKGAVDVAREFFEVQDKEQWEWLNEHGTDKEKEDYQTEIDKRELQKVRVKVEDGDDDKKRARKSSGTTTAGKKTATKSKTAKKSIDDLDDDDDDKPLFLLAGKKKPAAAKQEPRVKKEEVDDDDDVKDAPSPRSGRTSGKKASPVKKEVEEEEAADSDDDEEEEEEEEEEDVSPSKKKAAAAAKKKPAAKKVNKKPKAKTSAKKPAGKKAAKKPAAKKGGKKKK